MDSSYSPLTEVWRYDSTKSQWQKTADMETPRHHHGVSAVEWDFIVPFFCDQNIL